jgi:hypothetical protein
MYTKRPAEALIELSQFAAAIHAQTGQLPSPGEAAKAYEKQLRERLEDFGVTTPPPKQAQQNGQKKVTARPIGSDLSTPTKPRPKPTTRAEQIKQAIADLDHLDEDATAR